MIEVLKHEAARRERVAMEERVVRALNSAWQAIGADVLQSYVDCGEASDIYAVTMKGTEVRDVVRSCGYVGGYMMTYGNDEEATRWMEAQSRTTQDRLLKKAFPNTRYCM